VSRRRKRVLIDVKPLVQLERLYDELNPPPANPQTIELAEVAPGSFAMPKPRPGMRPNPGPRRPRLSEIAGSINEFGEQLEQQLGDAFRKAFK
jgi:hypothetical protein